MPHAAGGLSQLSSSTRTYSKYPPARGHFFAHARITEGEMQVRPGIFVIGLFAALVTAPVDVFGAAAPGGG